MVLSGLVDQLDLADADLIIDARAVLLNGQRSSHRATNGSGLLGCCNGLFARGRPAVPYTLR
jgi:hypothetical protein